MDVRMAHLEGSARERHVHGTNTYCLTNKNVGLVSMIFYLAALTHLHSTDNIRTLIVLLSSERAFPFISVH